MNQVFRAMVRKDLYMMRGFMLAVALCGLGALWLASLGGRAFAVGGVLFLTANVAGAIFISTHSVLTERKEQARQFALSLPISGERYDLAKLAGAALSFMLPWLVLTVAAASTFLLPGAERPGMLVWALMIQGCVLALFWTVLAALFYVRTDATLGLVILVANIAFTLFMVGVNQPEVTTPLRGATLVWTALAQRVLLLEALITGLALGVALLTVSRRRDHL